ncbi:unnamed protein product [Heterobilharzia americana]|nr:unnamed protein product [Heterobilharzia americana]
MGKARQTKRFAAMKRMISLKDSRIKKRDQFKKTTPFKQDSTHHLSVKHNPEVFPCLKDSYNEALGPPYHILLDTNYVNFSIKNRLDLFKSVMDCLLAKCFLYVTDCVMGK